MQLIHQASLLQPIHERVEIGGIFVRQHLAPVLYRIIGIDLQQLLPLRPCLVGPAEMSVDRREKRARHIRIRVADQPPLEQFDGVFVSAELKLRLRSEVQEHVGLIGVQGAGAIKTFQRLRS